MLPAIITADYYRTATIPKFRKHRGKKIQNGTRLLTIPNDELKEAQRELLKDIQGCMAPGSVNAHAYRSGRSIRTMAEPHVGKKYLMRIDIKDFFPSVTLDKLNFLLLHDQPRSLSERISQLCFINGALPQGAPTSPAISNLAMLRFDKAIRTLIQRWHKNRPFFRADPIEYTRYADDLVFSSNYPNLFRLKDSVISLLKKIGYAVNQKKVVCLSQPHRLEVCGVVVNQKISKARSYRRGLRSELHRIIIDRSRLGHTKNTEGMYREISFDSLRSKVSHVKYLDDLQGENLAVLLAVAEEAHTSKQDTWSEYTKEYVARYTKTTVSSR